MRTDSTSSRRNEARADKTEGGGGVWPAGNGAAAAAFGRPWMVARPAGNPACSVPGGNACRRFRCRRYPALQ